jgi:hypothetical protein
MFQVKVVNGKVLYSGSFDECVKYMKERRMSGRGVRVVRGVPQEALIVDSVYYARVSGSVCGL